MFIYAVSKPSPWGEGGPKGRVWGKRYCGITTSDLAYARPPSPQGEGFSQKNERLYPCTDFRPHITFRHPSSVMKSRYEERLFMPASPRGKPFAPYGRIGRRSTPNKKAPAFAGAFSKTAPSIPEVVLQRKWDFPFSGSQSYFTRSASASRKNC